MAAIFWFRRDLRLADNEALHAAARSDSKLIPVVTADQIGTPFDALSPMRKDSLLASWDALDLSLDQKLIKLASPRELVALAKSQSIKVVFATQVFDPNGIRELSAVAKDLREIGSELVVVGSNYAVEPGKVRKVDTTPYRVYTPFFREWLKHLDPKCFPAVSKDCFFKVEGFHDETFIKRVDSQIRAGEAYALETLDRFLKIRVGAYHELRDRADLGGTSHLSHALSHGEIHPRTILSKLPEGDGADTYRKEIAWREFYADVLFHNPSSLNDYLNSNFKLMQYDERQELIEAWKCGKTGFPMVDAGMRQLLETGWMHNRVRMIVASFLVKDLHVEWQVGAEWFEQNLTDYDPASNSHGWQWTAGCGTDASPYYRIFNPVSQGLKFDPNGDYVRKFVPELRHLQGATAHEPWNSVSGYELGYPKQIVDHAQERLESLRRLEVLKTKP